MAKKKPDLATVVGISAAAVLLAVVGTGINWGTGQEIAATEAPLSQPAAGVKLVSETRAATKSDSRPLEITPALLRKKFRGRAKYDAESRTLTLFYDFKRKNQLDDFEGHPVWAAGSIGIPSGEHALHVAKFTTVTIGGMVAMKSAKNPDIVWTTGGFAFGRTGADLGIGRWDVSAAPPVPIPNAYIYTHDGPPESVRVAPFEIILTHKMVFRMAGKEIGQERKEKTAVGQVRLHSGDAGTMFSQLTISGEIDEKWAEEFFSR